MTTLLCFVLIFGVFTVVRWDLGSLVAVGCVAVTASGFTLVVLASLLHSGESMPGFP